MALWPAMLFGSAQQPDYLLLKGEVYKLYVYPLESAFNEEVHARPGVFFEGANSTGNRRGYIATWALHDDKLSLMKIEKRYYRHLSRGLDEIQVREVDLDRVFPGQHYPLLASWYSGIILLPQKRWGGYAPMKDETLLKIEKGLIVQNLQISRTPADLFRSDEDLSWVSLGHGEQPSNEDWMDARFMLPPFDSHANPDAPFKTRGIFSRSPQAARLLIPRTPRTMATYLLIQQLPTGCATPEGAPVEIEGRLVRGADEKCHLDVIALRPLQPGETIHAKAFPAVFEERLRQQHPENPAATIRQ